MPRGWPVSSATLTQVTKQGREQISAIMAARAAAVEKLVEAA
ncbi:MAG: hypothetical protein ACP5XB_09670 [Isosphaeraceae bacterium]